MKKILIIYTSTTGNTEQITNLLQQHLDNRQFEVSKKDIGMEDIEVQDLLDYEGILFGTYTYDDGDLPYEVEDFYEDLDQVDLSGIIVGIYGSGDTSYPSFCNAVDLMQEQFHLANAAVIEHTVKVDLYPDEENDQLAIAKLADHFIEKLTISTFQGIPFQNPPSALLS